MTYKKLNEDWEFNILNVYNYRKELRLRHYFDFVSENHDRIEGDILEAGVYTGISLFAMGLLLKELGSDKTVYGYDSWSGFPPIYGPEDDLSQFKRFYESGLITDEHYKKVKKNIEYRSFSLGLDPSKELNASNISLSGNFTKCSKADVQKKLNFLGLDNVVLVEGSFADTMKIGEAPFKSLSAALIDADLYQSYVSSLPFIWRYLNRGGFVALDEYYSLKFPGARIATDNFFAKREDKPQRKMLVEGDFERWYVRRLYD